jgi:hypothetical protein
MDPYILYGLEDLSETSRVAITPYVTSPNNYFLISNYKEVPTPSEIAIVLRYS